MAKYVIFVNGDGTRERRGGTVWIGRDRLLQAARGVVDKFSLASQGVD